MPCLIYLNTFEIKCGKKGVSIYMIFDVELIYVEFNKFKERETFVVIFTHFENAVFSSKNGLKVCLWFHNKKKNQDGGSQ